MTTISYPLRIDEKIMPLVDLKARDEYIDKSTALRKLLYRGVEDYLLELYEEGRISIGRVAEILNKSIDEVQNIIQKKGIKVEHSLRIYKKSRETAKKLLSLGQRRKR